MKPFSYRPLAAAIGISVAFSLSAQAENNVPHDAGATAGGLSGAFAIQIKTEAGKTKFETANVDFKSLIVDVQGRVSYIIDFEDSATLPYLRGPEPSDNLPDWHKPEMRRFIAAFSQYYGFEVSGLTSWLGSSAAAFLNEDQLNAVLQDPRVKRITPNSRIELPQPPLVERANEAPDPAFFPQANQFAGDNAFAIAPIGWNITYMGGSQAGSSNSTTIYIVDTGVGKHDNLPSTMVRVNPQLPSGLSPTGCASHSAHVAGIIAGLGSQGVSGLYRGAPVVSVSIYKNSANSGDCVTGPASAETLTRAFDYVFQEITKKQKMGVVTMSVNLVANQESVYESLRKLVKPNPATNYKGAVFVQSAGNRSSDDPNKKDTKSACEASFNDRNNDDGVIIVGAIDSNGQPAVPLNGINGLRNMRTNVIPNAYPGFFIAAADERGTRYDPPGEGQCVDIWAPGKEIYSTWGNTDDNNNGYRQSDSGSLSKGYAYLSGTSMAAPHIAALAAHTIDYYGLTTPAQVEQKIRSMRVNTGQPVYNRNGYDFNQPIYVARFFGGTPPLSKPTIEFAFKNTMAHEVVSGFVADDSANIINSTIKIYNTRDIFLYYDSVGAKSCTVTRYLNNISQGIVTNSLVSSQLVSGLLPIGTHRWDASCTAPNGQVSTASTTAIVEALAPLPIPQVTWTINGQAVSGTIGKTTSDSFTLAYSSSHADSCNVQRETSSNGSTFVPWDYSSNTGVSYSWGTLQFATGWYRWTAICTGNGGTTSQPLTIQVTAAVPVLRPCLDTVPIYSLQYVGPSGHDTYLTTSGSEYNNARAVGYTPVGIIARLPRTQVANTTQFRRFYNTTRHNHIATYSSTEIPYLLANGWGNDGIVGYIYTSQQSGTMPLYRLWKDHTGRDDTEHRYTVNWSDVPSLVQQGWGYDGVYGYVCP